MDVIVLIAMYSLWMAVFEGGSSFGGFSKSQLVTYLILSRVLRINSRSGVNMIMSEQIREGGIASQMLRPFDLQLSYASQNFGDIVTDLIFHSGIVLAVVAPFFGILPPASTAHAVLFFLSVVLSFSIAFLIDFSVGLIAFYTTNAWGINVMKNTIISFLSGALVPIAFFPESLRNILMLLPFASLIDAPISIYLGKFGQNEILKTLAVQCTWMIILFIFSRFFFLHAIRKVTVQGG